MNWTFWLRWLAGNTLWLILAPRIYGFGLYLYVQWDFSSGYRTSTNGDSLGIPIAGFTVFNWMLTIALNLSWGLYALIKRWRTA